MADDEQPIKRPHKMLVSLNLDEDVFEKLMKAAEVTKRSRSNVANLVLHRNLDAIIKEPDLL